MSSYERMHALLKSTGLYRLDGTTAVEIELQRYAFYFDQLEAMIAQLLEDAFVETMGPTGFDAWQKLLALPGNLTVYPGHDEPTTLEHERMFNPFV